VEPSAIFSAKTETVASGYRTRCIELVPDLLVFAFVSTAFTPEGGKLNLLGGNARAGRPAHVASAPAW
jgi:hypothetical protein